MNIRIIGIDGLGGHEVKRLFFNLTDNFDFIKAVGIREFHNSCGDVLNIYDVTIEIKPDRDNYVSIHIFDNSFYIVDTSRKYDEAIIDIDRSAYEKLEII